MTQLPHKPPVRASVRRTKNSIKRDGIHPALYLKYRHAISCEDCSHFCWETESCTIGYVSRWHRRAFQQEEYERTGKMALCRFIEID